MSCRVSKSSADQNGANCRLNEIFCLQNDKMVKATWILLTIRCTNGKWHLHQPQKKNVSPEMSYITTVSSICKASANALHGHFPVFSVLKYRNGPKSMGAEIHSLHKFPALLGQAGNIRLVKEGGGDPQQESDPVRDQHKVWWQQLYTKSYSGTALVQTLRH
jgi:hypothetical protein